MCTHTHLNIYTHRYTHTHMLNIYIYFFKGLTHVLLSKTCYCQLLFWYFKRAVDRQAMHSCPHSHIRGTRQKLARTTGHGGGHIQQKPKFHKAVENKVLTKRGFV